MRTITKLTLALVALAAIAGAGIVSAHGGFGGIQPFRGAAAVRDEDGNVTKVECDGNMTVGDCRALLGDPCDDTMTVDECKAAWEAKREEAKARGIAACTERTGNATRCEEMAERGPRGHGHGGPPRGPPRGDRPEPPA